MYNLSVSAQDVHKVLGKHILADGYDLTYDIEKSRGVYMHDSKNNKNLLDFFTCFAERLREKKSNKINATANI